MLALVNAMAACAQAPLNRGGLLASYTDMTPSDGTFTKSIIRVKKSEVLAAKTVVISPTVFSEDIGPSFTDAQRKLVANSIDRSLCVGLSDRYRVVSAGEPADLSVRIVVTNVIATDEVAAGASKVVASVPMFLSLGYPVLVPRIPVGLGSLSVEAEARGPLGEERAAILWGRGANALSRPRISKTADAYELATSFGEDFSKLLNTGESPFGKMPSVPSLQKVGFSLGGAPTNAVCEAFGRDPGLVGMVGGNMLGLPPEWTDKGGQ